MMKRIKNQSPRNKAKVLVIIPARGGSKRFPGKNTHLLNGKPLIAYPIIAALKSKLIDRVVVSTDDKKIASVAKRFGAQVPFLRPKPLATATAPVVDAMIHAVVTLKKEHGYKPDYVILLQPTTPLVESRQIDEAIKLAVRHNADSVVAVTQINTVSHPFNLRNMKKNGTIGFWQNAKHYAYVSRPKPAFYSPANLWLTKTDYLLKHKKLEGTKNYPLVLDNIYGFDIDFKDDLEFLEAHLKYSAKKK